MSIKVTQNSFSKGILSPSLQGRVDLEQYALGLKKITNGIVLQEGCVLNRAGLKFIEKTKNNNKKVKLIPFIFNLNQSYIIEAGDMYMRFLKDGGYILDDNDEIYEIQSPYSEDELYELDYVQQSDVMTIVHKNHKPYELSRLDHNNWQLDEINFQPKVLPPSNVQISYHGSASSNTTTYEYVVCSVDIKTKEESTRSSVVSVVGHLEAYWTTSEYILLSWDAVDNAVEYNIYRSVNGIFGYVGTSANTTFKDNNIEPDLKSCAPIYVNPFLNENPTCVCYYQQRKIYSSSDNSPQTLWASQTGTNNNFNISRPLNSTDAITMSIYDNVANKIQHLIPFDDLIVMTNNAEWCVNGSDKIFSASPAPVAKLQSYYGSSKIKPVLSGSMVLFVQSGGSIVRDLGYNYLSDSYDGQELTLLATHLFEGKTIVDMCYSKEPYRILWCVMDDGTVNALTYNPKQKISAWHTHITKGKFECCTTIRENNEDIVYFVVNRVIDGISVRYIERMNTRVISSMKDAFFLDCALKWDFENKVSRISGLNHLKNEKVNALLDYGVVENLQVDSNGSLELPYSAKHILIGLPYAFEIETLNLETQSTLDINKVVNKVEVKILNSREDFFILNDNNTLSQNARSHESINNSEMLFDTNVEFCPLNTPSKTKSITLIQKYPLPINILAISCTVSLSDVEAQ